MSPLTFLSQLTDALVHDNVAVVRDMLRSVHATQSYGASSELLFLLHQLCRYHHVRRHTECVNAITGWLYDSELFVDVVFCRDIQAGKFLSFFFKDVDKFLTFVVDHQLLSYEPRVSNFFSKHLQSFQQGRYADLVM